MELGAPPEYPLRPWARNREACGSGQGCRRGIQGEGSQVYGGATHFMLPKHLSKHA